MAALARLLYPAKTAYRGSITDPRRWSTWVPRQGDVLVCTPPKCGTTWTQTMLAMLIHGADGLPGPIPVISPWVDADLGVPADEVARNLDAQTDARVVKTHTPLDGVPLWDGVPVVAVYRHPLDVFFSLRKHQANVRQPDRDEPMCWDLDRAFDYFIDEGADLLDFDRDKLATITRHYRETALSDRVLDLAVFHYADMRRDPLATVKRLAKAANIVADPDLIARVAQASSFDAMKSNAVNYVPVGGTGYWKSDAGFFDSGSSGKWQGVLSDAQITRYQTRLAALVPDAKARAWLEAGTPY